jgi:hypothetical protein
MTRYVDNPICYEAVEDFRDKIADFEFDEVSLAVVIQRCKSKNAPHKNKMCALELVAEKLERDIELLNTQIQSYSFQHPKQFYEKLKSPKPKDIVSSFDFLIDEYPGNQQIDHLFFDPVANYMELFFSVTVQACFFCKNPSYHPLPVHISVLIFIKHDEEAQSRDQLLGWLHWHFFIT